MRTLAHLSDLHFGRHDPDIAEALLASLAAHRPDLVVVSGDFTQRARRSEFAQARAFLDRIAAPKLVIPGNHDVPLYDIVARFITPLSRYGRYVAPTGVEASYFEDDEIAVLGVNTARSWTRKNGRVSVEQIAEIRRVLSQAPGSRSKILVTHHPLDAPSGAGPLDMAGRARRALQAISEAKVQVLLSGHYHRAVSGHVADTASGGLVLVIHAGTAISTRTRGEDGNNYNILRIEPGGVSAAVMAWRPRQGFCEVRACAYHRENGAWRPD